MKKKLLLIVMALVCALTCALGLAACENPDDKTVKGKAIGNSYITKIELCDESGEFVGYLNETGKTCDKGKKYIIRVTIPNRYELGTMKMLINDAETNITYDKDISPVSIYKGEFTATEDFEITFSGTPERKTIDIGISAYAPDGWKDRFAVPNALRVNVLINGNNANAGAFKNAVGEESNSLEHFIELIADNALRVKADDHVDIYVYSTNNDYILTRGVLNADSNTGMTYETYEEYNEDHVKMKGLRYQFDVKRTDIELRLSLHENDIKVQE